MHKNNIFTLIFAVLGGSMLFACANGPEVPREDYGSLAQIQYGIVEDVEVVGLHTQAGEGAIIGGLAGLAASHHPDLGDVVVGAAAGALLTRAVERKRAKQVVVDLVDGREVKVVVGEDAAVSRGDCVAVEDGRTANVRRVSPVLCEDNATAHRADYAPHAISAADACHAAKVELLNTSTEAAFDQAERKVRVLCGN